ncbi:hypothetical protein Nepgr_005323 [Nepenthes gracilis]|uniref:Uncharacterized protein n=1 Tax=Nepenthes gracilis TaxID=150966 RepID=A0AAD3S2Z6_NEPGR|nr:hypothetical protein Nepgr_005323 [Nepenthes gracilis]
MSTKLQYPVTGIEVAAEDRPAGDGGFCNGPAGRGGAVGVNEMLPMLVHSAAVSVASDVLITVLCCCCFSVCRAHGCWLVGLECWFP